MAKTNLRLQKLKRRLLPYLPLLTRVVIGAVVVVLIFVLIRNLPTIINKLKTLSPLQRTALSLVQNPQNVLQTTQGRTNVLILGKGGASHETPDLTDTIILISYHHKSHTAVMLSLPRDIWIESLQAKINTAYYYGNLKKPGEGGLILAKAAVTEVIDQPVHYAVVIDFDGFIKLIDLLGGIDINVPETFDDYKYPIPGKETAIPETDRYEHLHFDKGLEHMDGSRALKYTRSRNSEGPQGTDFARAARQQQVIVAIQQKLLSTQTLLKPTKITNLIQTLASSVDTDIKNGDTLAFIKLALSFDRQNLTNAALDQGDPESDKPGLLTNPPTSQYDGQWVLIGQDQGWQEVQDYVDSLLKQ